MSWKVSQSRLPKAARRGQWRASSGHTGFYDPSSLKVIWTHPHWDHSSQKKKASRWPLRSGSPWNQAICLESSPFSLFCGLTTLMTASDIKPKNFFESRVMGFHRMGLSPPVTRTVTLKNTPSVVGSVMIPRTSQEQPLESQIKQLVCSSSWTLRRIFLHGGSDTVRIIWLQEFCQIPRTSAAHKKNPLRIVPKFQADTIEKERGRIFPLIIWFWEEVLSRKQRQNCIRHADPCRQTAPARACNWPYFVGATSTIHKLLLSKDLSCNNLQLSISFVLFPELFCNHSWLHVLCLWNSWCNIFYCLWFLAWCPAREEHLLAHRKKF